MNKQVTGKRNKTTCEFQNNRNYIIFSPVAPKLMS